MACCKQPRAVVVLKLVPVYVGGMMNTEVITEIKRQAPKSSLIKTQPSIGKDSIYHVCVCWVSPL